jgi:hypothetical protein
MDDLGYRANFEEYPSFDDQDSHLSRNPTASPAIQKSNNSNAPNSGVISNYDTYKKIRNNANNQSNKLMIHDQNRNISNINNNDEDNLKSNKNNASNLIANKNAINNNHQLTTLQTIFNNNNNSNIQETNQSINNISNSDTNNNNNNNASSSILNLCK